jgi:uncharacterized protein (DUF1015 family)
VPRLFPFEALVYDTTVAGSLDLVTAPPYDVISDARRRDHLSASPFSVVHLDLAEGSSDPADPKSRYARAAHLLNDWEARGALVRTEEPIYFAYEMRFSTDGRPDRVRGVLGAIDLEDWGGGVVPHERTMPGPVEDRLRLLRATRTHLSPVYGTVDGPCPRLTTLLDVVTAVDPRSLLEDEQGVQHRMWPIPGDEPVAEWLAAEPLLIADGHHRYTTALHYRSERRAADGPGRWDRLLTFVVDAGSERISVLPFHRVQLRGDVPHLGTAASSLGEVLDAISDDDLVIGVAIARGSHVEYRTARLHGHPPAVRALHKEVLDGRSPTLELRFVPDAYQADASVRDGSAVAAWFLPATKPDRIRKVVQRGERLPQKSTYFWPKPRTGMVMMPLEPVSRSSRPRAS